MTSSLFQVAKSILRTENCLVVKWIHELLKIFEHRICIKLVGNVLLLGYIDAIFEILLYCASQACIRLIDSSLNFHEPSVASFHISRQNASILQVMRCNMEQSHASKWIDQWLNIDLPFVFLVRIILIILRSL